MSGDGSLIAGKEPTSMVNLKSGVIALKANMNVIPRDKNRTVSIVPSGGSQMSAILGASENMTEYYPYLYEACTRGDKKRRRKL